MRILRKLPGLELAMLGSSCLACFLTISLAAAAEPSPGSLRLTEVAESAGVEFVLTSGRPEVKNYLFEAKGGGAALFDFDQDGWLDLLLTQGSNLSDLRAGQQPLPGLFRNLQNGRFEDVTKKAGLRTSGWGMGVSIGDYDNDGRPDIYLTCLTKNLLYRNLGDGIFEDVTDRAGVGDESWSASAAFGDYDGDGYLDLFVCNYVKIDFNHLPEPGSGPRCNYRGRSSYCGPLGLQGAPNRLYRNRGDGRFEDVTEASGLADLSPYFSLGAVWSDIDDDGDLDLLIANDSTPNHLMLNLGDGTFEDIGLRSGLAANADGRFQASMGVDVADFNNDGLLDVYATHFASDYSTLYRNRGELSFLDVSTMAQIVQPEWLLVSWGTRFVDLDHDGWKDLVHSNGHVYPFLQTAGWAEQYGQPLSVYLNRGDETFRDVSRDLGEDALEPTVSRGVAFGDYDNDGDTDFAVANLDGKPQLFRNDFATENHWVMFRLRGTAGNRDAIGARLTLETGGLTQLWEIKRADSIYSASDPRAHFGLGGESTVKRLQVRWPGGRTEEFKDLTADTHYLIEEGKGLAKEFP